MKNLGVFVAIMILCVPWLTRPVDAEATAYLVQQLTDNNYSKTIAASYQNSFVWTAFDGTADQLYYFNGETTKQITFTDYPYTNLMVRLSGHYITWLSKLASEPRAERLYVYNISTGATSLIGDSSKPKYSLAIDGDLVVWSQNDEFDPSYPTINIYLDNLATNQLAQVTSDTEAAVSNDDVHLDSATLSWTRVAGGRTQLYRQNLSSGQVTQLADATGTSYQAVAVAGQVAWWQYTQTSKNEVLYLNDGQNNRQLAESAEHGVLIAAGHRLAWGAPCPTDATLWCLQVYDLTTGVSELLGQVTGLYALSDNRVAWVDPSDPHRLYVKDYQTGVTTLVTSGVNFDNSSRQLVVGDQLVAWAAYDKTESYQNIFRATPLSDWLPPVVTPSTSPLPNNAGWYNSPVTVNWRVSDPAPSAGLGTLPAANTINTEGANQLVVSQLACDKAGNCARGSTRISLDKTPPLVTNPAVSSPLVLLSSPVSLSANVSDGLSGVTTAEYYIDNDPGAGHGRTMVCKDGKATASTSLNLSIGLHKFFIRAQDAAGNWSPPTSVSFIYL